MHFMSKRETNRLDRQVGGVDLHGSCWADLSAGGDMLRKGCQIVLLLLLLMAVITPLLQLDSWDRFPISSDDIECQVTDWLCSIGMLLIFAAMLKLVQVLRLAIAPALFPPPVQSPSHASEILYAPDFPPPLLIPLRI
jgi:hypothetical protein